MKSTTNPMFTFVHHDLVSYDVNSATVPTFSLTFWFVALSCWGIHVSLHSKKSVFPNISPPHESTTRLASCLVSNILTLWPTGHQNMISKQERGLGISESWFLFWSVMRTFAVWWALFEAKQSSADKLSHIIAKQYIWIWLWIILSEKKSKW